MFHVGEENYAYSAKLRQKSTESMHLIRIGFGVNQKAL